MKTKVLLPILFAFSTALLSSQASATGLTYDPYEIYYSTYYGIDASTTQAPQIKAEENVDPVDPYASFYNTYYGTDGLQKASTIKIEAIKKENTVDMSDVSDPSNYYNW